MTLVYEEVGGEATHGVTVSTASGPARATGRFDRDARSLLAELRARMYRPGEGTWYTATVVRPRLGRDDLRLRLRPRTGVPVRPGLVAGRRRTVPACAGEHTGVARREDW